MAWGDTFNPMDPRTWPVDVWGNTVGELAGGHTADNSIAGQQAEQDTMQAVQQTNDYANAVRLGISQGYSPADAVRYADEYVYAKGSDQLPLRDTYRTGDPSLLPTGGGLSQFDVNDGPIYGGRDQAGGPVTPGVFPGGLPPRPGPPPPPGFNPSVGWQQAMGMLPQYGGQQLTPNAQLSKWGLFASQGGPQQPGGAPPMMPPKPPLQPLPPGQLPVYQPPPLMPKPPMPGTLSSLPTLANPIPAGRDTGVSPGDLGRPMYDQPPSNAGERPGDGTGFSAGGLVPYDSTPPSLRGVDLGGRTSPINSDIDLSRAPSKFLRPPTSTQPSSQPTLSAATPSIAGSSSSTSTPTARTAVKGIF